LSNLKKRKGLVNEAMTNKEKKISVLMIGVDRNRNGGMWTVADTFISSKEFNNKIDLCYVATSTSGSKITRILKMAEGYAKAFNVLLCKRVDIVHIHMAERGSVYRKGFLVYLSKIFGKKVVVQMHAGPIMSWYQSLSAPKQAIVKKIFCRADKMLVLGEYWKKQLNALLPSDKLAVLYNGAECPQENPYNPEGRNILYLGLLKKTKGVFDLVDAIKLIDRELPTDTKVYLCGIDEEGTLVNYIQKKKLQHRFVLPGWVDKGQRNSLFAQSQMCVLPSYFEALSMTVIESMCHGIPMITTNISTMSEMLGSEIELIEPGDIKALAQIILRVNQDRALRCQMSRVEYQRAKELFSIVKIMQSVLEIYQKL